MVSSINAINGNGSTQPPQGGGMPSEIKEALTTALENAGKTDDEIKDILATGGSIDKDKAIVSEYGLSVDIDSILKESMPAKPANDRSNANGIFADSLTASSEESEELDETAELDLT